jgi:hypothetical protein
MRAQVAFEPSSRATSYDMEKAATSRESTVVSVLPEEKAETGDAPSNDTLPKEDSSTILRAPSPASGEASGGSTTSPKGTKKRLKVKKKKVGGKPASADSASAVSTDGDEIGARSSQDTPEITRPKSVHCNKQPAGSMGSLLATASLASEESPQRTRGASMLTGQTRDSSSASTPLDLSGKKKRLPKDSEQDTTTIGDLFSDISM